MKNLLIPVGVAMLLSSGVSFAADQPPGNGPRAACRADVEKLCAGVQHGDGRIVACLQQNQAQVSPACKDALAKMRPRGAPPAPATPPE